MNANAWYLYPEMTSFDEFKADMVKHLTLLRADVNRSTAALDLLKNRVDEHDTLLRCVNGGVQFAYFASPCSANCCHSSQLLPGCSNHASSMLSMRDIASDYITSGRCEEYAEPGSCGRAAHEAKVFFNGTHALMKAQVIRGVLFSPSGGELLLKADGLAPKRDPCALVARMRPFVLQEEEGCIWKPEDGGMVLEPDSNKTGFKHYITLVCTLEGLQVAVDWSLGQFENVPADIRLYLP